MFRLRAFEEIQILLSAKNKITFPIIRTGVVG